MSDTSPEAVERHTELMIRYNLIDAVKCMDAQAARIAELKAALTRDLNAELIDQQQADRERIAELEAEVARLREELGKARREERLNIQTVSAFEAGFEAGAERAEAEVARLQVALCESCIAPEALMIAGKPRDMSDELWAQIVSALEMARAALQEKPHAQA